jgi:hypothetical protein
MLKGLDLQAFNEFIVPGPIYDMMVTKHLQDTTYVLARFSRPNMY